VGFRMDAVSLHAVPQAGRFTRVVANGRQAAERATLPRLWFCVLFADTIKYLCLILQSRNPQSVKLSCNGSPLLSKSIKSPSDEVFGPSAAGVLLVAL
jgi:hypothetical protein